VDRRREATLRQRVRGERGVVGDGDGADDGPSEAVVVVDAGVRSRRWKGSKRRWTCSGGITGAEILALKGDSYRLKDRDLARPAPTGD
jgi:hypothetical protein